MLVGKPVVVTNVGGTFELVKGNKSGLLFEPSDHNSLVEHLCQLIQDPKLRTFMGAEGKRIIAKKFSTKKYVQKFEDMGGLILP